LPVDALHPSSQVWLWQKNLLSGIAIQKHLRSKESCCRLLLENRSGAIMRKSLIVAVLPLLLMIADAHAQCAPTDKIYIDPRLVPRRPQISEEAWKHIGLSDTISPEQKAMFYRLLMQQNDPIEIPHGTGKVLVHPTNPCIQQYIP